MPRIEGTLPFDSLAAAGAAQAPLAGSPQQALAALPGAYNASYNSALAFNTANYSNVLSGYQNVLAGQGDALGAIGKGYTDLSSRVLAGLEGAGASERQRIGDQTQAQLGRAGQSLVSRGLGNSTVVDSVNRGIYSDQNRALTDLADRLQQQRAGITSNLGLAGLAQQQQAALANSALGRDQLGFMERVNAPYPDAGLYSAIAQRAGAAQQGAAGGGTRLLPGTEPQSPGTVSRGGGGFFTQPTDTSSGGNYQPQRTYGGVQSARPPLGAVGSPAAGDAAKSYFDNLYGGAYAGFGGGDVTPTAAGALGGGLGAAGLGELYPPQGFDAGQAVGGAGAFAPAGPYDNPWGGFYGFLPGGQSAPQPAATPDVYGYF